MDLSEYRNIVETDWLAENLDDPNLRIIDCTSLLSNYFEDSAADGLILESGHDLWEQGHIPGATFADLLEALSDQSNQDYMYALPSADTFASVMSNLGIGNNHAVVLYDQRVNMWAARLWWMLKTFGFDNAAVLNGGWTKWVAEQRPISTANDSYPKTQFQATYRPELVAQRDEVKAAIDQDEVQLINALDPDEFAGRPPQRYARAGRIPSSVNIPFATTADPESQIYADDNTLNEIFQANDATQKQRVICYCGGGIAATSTALLLDRMGIDNVAVYDGSMTQWANDPSLPMETG